MAPRQVADLLRGRCRPTHRKNTHDPRQILRPRAADVRRDRRAVRFPEPGAVAGHRPLVAAEDGQARAAGGRCADPRRLHRHGRSGLGLLAGGRRERRPSSAPTSASRCWTIGREKCRRAGAEGQITLLEADTLQLPFPDDTFQIVCVAFGLRNVSDTDAGLREMARVCRPGGRVAVLEFSTPTAWPLGAIYGWYFRHVLPRIGQALARNTPGGLQLSSAERRPVPPGRGPGRADAGAGSGRGVVPPVYVRRGDALRGHEVKNRTRRRARSRQLKEDYDEHRCRSLRITSEWTRRSSVFIRVHLWSS